MNENEPVMKADCNFVWRIRFVLNPVAHIVHKLAHFNFDPIARYPDIAFAGSIFPSPAPNTI